LAAVASEGVKKKGRAASAGGPRAVKSSSGQGPTSSALSGQSFASVYDGQHCIGHVLARGRSGYEAFDADDHSLGVFTSVREAAAALPTKEAAR